MNTMTTASSAGEAAPAERTTRSHGSPFALGQSAAIDAKKLATLIARAALAGFELVQLADGTFIASRWGQFRTLPHFAAVEQFLRNAGAPE